MAMIRLDIPMNLNTSSRELSISLKIVGSFEYQPS